MQLDIYSECGWRASGLVVQLEVWGGVLIPRLGAAESVSCGLCKTGVTACLPIKTRGDKEIKVPGAMWADAHKSAAIGSQGSVEMRSCKNIFSSLTCHPWSRDA